VGSHPSRLGKQKNKRPREEAPGDAEALKAALVCRVKRSILNMIQADEETPWSVVKDRLKKAFGGGRWAPALKQTQL
ncbi:hypothetical protein, partial [Klebsiella pneumoniae]|uniref:hypothetical protein n=1 Tax=Klebsiella pneumoniae TaxID=573 RepID=UPI00405570A0